MPLDKSGSKTSVGTNIKTEMAAGKPKKQAIAIAMNTQRNAGGGTKFNKGGSVCAPSVEQQFENNIAETAANPTSKPGWRRW